MTHHCATYQTTTPHRYLVYAVKTGARGTTIGAPLEVCGELQLPPSFMLTILRFRFDNDVIMLPSFKGQFDLICNLVGTDGWMQEFEWPV